MSSLEIAELTGKRHTDVMRDTRKMLTQLDKSADAFLRRRSDAQGKSREFFVLDHDHTICLVSGYKVQLRMAVIQRLRALESGEATPWHEQQAEAEHPGIQSQVNAKPATERAFSCPQQGTPTMTNTNPRTAVDKLTGRLSLCTGCGEVFGGVSSFDKHRALRDGVRVCRDPAELGMVIGHRKAGSYWRYPSTDYTHRLSQDAA